MAVLGKVVLVQFPIGEVQSSRPAVVLSTEQLPDAIVGLLTSRISVPLGSTDYVLKDWAAAGLGVPTIFRSFLVTLPQTAILKEIGRLSDVDWKEVQARLRIALAVT